MDTFKTVRKVGEIYFLFTVKQHRSMNHNHSPSAGNIEDMESFRDQGGMGKWVIDFIVLSCT